MLYIYIYLCYALIKHIIFTVYLKFRILSVLKLNKFQNINVSAISIYFKNKINVSKYLIIGTSKLNRSCYLIELLYILKNVLLRDAIIDRVQ